jgi:hypothetical protein
MLVPWSKVGIIEAGHFSVDTAYAAVDRHRVDDYKPYIYRTHDGGKTWQLTVDGIPDGSFVNAVREDPVKKGLLYAGTELGMYVSFDDGDHWQPLQLNLPVTSIRDMDLHHDQWSDDLVIATHGRAFWILDSVASLRQLDSVGDAPAALFKPDTAVRLHLPAFTGTPMHKDEPKAPNPPVGAALDYWLKADVPDVAVEILDAKGQLVRHYSSADPHPAPDLSKIDGNAEWYVTPAPPSAAAGMHRFTWDLRYAAPDALDGGGGVWVLPGTYTVKLTVAGKAYSQTVKVVNDPRVKASDADLAKQHALALQVQAERVKLAAAVDEVTTTLKQLEALAAKAPADLAAQLKAFEAELSLQTELHAVPPGFGQPGGAPEKVGSLAYVTGAMDALQPAVEAADGAPTADALKGFGLQKAKAAKAIEAWQKLKAAREPALDAALKAAGLETLGGK